MRTIFLYAPSAPLYGARGAYKKKTLWIAPKGLKKGVSQLFRASNIVIVHPGIMLLTFI